MDRSFAGFAFRCARCAAACSIFKGRAQADPVVGVLGATEPPGSLLLRIGVGPRKDATRVKTLWESQLEHSKIENISHAVVRVLVFQGRNLPAADSNGSLDPYVKVRFMDTTQKTQRRDMTKNPSWFETKTTRAPIRGYRPGLEVLEDRITPSNNITFEF